ncbi:MAG: hypothetical protein HRT36_02630 [Alphaproteobacteria bacterium]|nr:hypothetical protein [Alphaproteobacteria bacterium]
MQLDLAHIPLLEPYEAAAFLAVARCQQAGGQATRETVQAAGMGRCKAIDALSGLVSHGVLDRIDRGQKKAAYELSKAVYHVDTRLSDRHPVYDIDTRLPRRRPVSEASTPTRPAEGKARVGAYSDETYNYVVRAWNDDAAARYGLQKVKKLSDKRRGDFDKAILVAIEMIAGGECADEPMTIDEAGSVTPEIAWGAVITAISSSDFLQGRTDRGWKPIFSWFFDGANKHKRIRETLEGKYNGKSRTGQTTDDLISELNQEFSAGKSDFGDVPQPQSAYGCCL